MRFIIKQIKKIPGLSLKLRRLFYFFIRAFEIFFWGGPVREKVLVHLLSLYYKSQFRREWIFNTTPPHFSLSRNGFFLFGFAPDINQPAYFYRAFYASEVVKRGDKVLDIGCGDGFFSKKFLSPQASLVHATDIENDAINTAKIFHSSSKIIYFLHDAVKDPFPLDQYEVIVWNGALGHFSSCDSNIVLEKISKSIGSQGVFIGSETLGKEGHDHLQFFDNIESLAQLLKRHFKYVFVKTKEYEIHVNNYLRTEAYWKCSNQEIQLLSHDWKKF